MKTKLKICYSAKIGYCHDAILYNANKKRQYCRPILNNKNLLRIRVVRQITSENATIRCQQISRPAISSDAFIVSPSLVIYMSANCY